MRNLIDGKAKDLCWDLIEELIEIDMEMENKIKRVVDKNIEEDFIKFLMTEGITRVLIGEVLEKESYMSKKSFEDNGGYFIDGVAHMDCKITGQPVKNVSTDDTSVIGDKES